MEPLSFTLHLNLQYLCSQAKCSIWVDHRFTRAREPVKYELNVRTKTPSWYLTIIQGVGREYRHFGFERFVEVSQKGYLYY